MKRVFFIVGPTATGKSEIAAEVASASGAEVISADAYQLYDGLDLLTAKPHTAMLAKVAHHLIGDFPLTEAMNAEKFRVAALDAIEEIQGRGKSVIVVGGSGLYVKALTHGLAPLPKVDHELRARLGELTLDELYARLDQVDPGAAKTIDRKNKRRLVRALEICSVTERPVSQQRTQWKSIVAADVAGGRDARGAETPLSSAETAPATTMSGVFLFRDRADLAQRIDQRVEAMFANGVVDEVQRVSEFGETAAKTLGFQQVRDLIAGKLSERECITAIQQATRRYAKRQLTWFRRQTTFESLNLSLHGTSAAIEWICQKARLSLAHD
ncbi:MAG: tRNA (adenosine(37)-N6)-dimethylallyltransferase MiaA [Chthoniobacterales bacterium]